MCYHLSGMTHLLQKKRKGGPILEDFTKNILGCLIFYGNLIHCISIQRSYKTFISKSFKCIFELHASFITLTGAMPTYKWHGTFTSEILKVLRIPVSVILRTVFKCVSRFKLTGIS